MTTTEDARSSTGVTTSSTPSPDRPEQGKDEGRDYIVLKRTPADSPGGNERFEKVAVVKAANPDQAATRACEIPGKSFLNVEGMTYLIATPVRNFTEVPVESETTTRIKVRRSRPST